MKHKGKKILMDKASVLILTILVCLLSSNYKITAISMDADETDNRNIIYLTFDDGPSNTITDKILNILNEKGVKATFFVVGQKIRGKEEILKRIVEEGHSIGLHTYTHNYKKIYASQENFIEEMDKTRDEIREVTGITSNLIRFPAGSKPYLNKEFLNKLHSKNYRVYDWNASLSDGLNYNAPPDKLLKESTRVVGTPSMVMLLMHCDEVNGNTCKTLPEIIEIYKSKGYRFKAITDDTPEFHFRFK